MSTPLQKKWAAKTIDADNIFNKDKQSVTFIYAPETDKLYSAPYETTGGMAHPELADTQFSAAQKRELNDDARRKPMLEKGYILGRMGHILYSKATGQPIDPRRDDPDAFIIPVIAFWNQKEHNFTDGQIKRTLQKLASEYPTYFDADPKDTIVTGKHGEGVKTSYLSDWGVVFSGGEPYKKKEESPDCRAIEKLNVKGQVLTLQNILGKLHQTRGQEGAELQATFCAAYPLKKRAAQAADCDLQSRMLDNLSARLKCGEEDYTKFKRGGRLAYRQRLKDIFSNPEEITKQFRTQAEIDAAWDELMYGKKSYEHFSFKEWLNAQ